MWYPRRWCTAAIMHPNAHHTPASSGVRAWVRQLEWGMIKGHRGSGLWSSERRPLVQQCPCHCTGIDLWPGGIEPPTSHPPTPLPAASRSSSKVSYPDQGHCCLAFHNAAKALYHIGWLLIASIIMCWHYYFQVCPFSTLLGDYRKNDLAPIKPT